MNQPTETAGGAIATDTATANATSAAPKVRRTRAKVIAATATAEPRVTSAKTDGNTPLVGTGTNIPPALVKTAERLQSLEVSVEQKALEIKRLQGLLKDAQKNRAAGGDEIRLPVTDGQLRKACDALIAGTRKDPSKPQRSLKAQFVAVEGKAVLVSDATEAQQKDAEHATPELTDGQRKTWKEARKQIDAMHSHWTRETAPKLIGNVKRLLKDKSAIAAGGMRYKTVGKAQKLIGSRIAVRLPNAPKPDAKPQVAP